MSLAPNAISDLELWLDADALTGLSDGDTVVTWDDQSGNGNDYTNSTPSPGITYETGELNGMPVVRFPNPNDGLDGLLSLTAPFSIFCVAKSSQSGAFGRTISGGVGAIWFMGTNSGFWWYRAGTNPFGPEISSGVSAAAGDWAIHGVIQEVMETREEYPFGGGIQYVYDLDTNALPVTTGMAPVVDVGTFLVGEAFGGDIAELVAYSRDLTVVERIGLTDYFREKWGGIVASSLEESDISALFAREGVVAAVSNDTTHAELFMAREGVVVAHHYPEELTEMQVARVGIVVAISRPHGWGIADDPAL